MHMHAVHALRLGPSSGCGPCTGGAGRFGWKPRLAEAVQSWNLPRTLWQPLKHMSDVTKGPALMDLASAHGEEAEEKNLQYPDLQVVHQLQFFAGHHRLSASLQACCN